MNSGYLVSPRALRGLISFVAFVGTLTAQANTPASVQSGATLQLSVSADGTAPFSYQWRKDGVDIPGAQSETLAVANAKGSDSGSYSARVANSMGSTVSDAAVVTVQNAAPVFATQPVSQAVDSGADATLNALVYASASSSYQWKKNGANIAGQTGTSLTLTSATQATAGSYSVVATNSGGSTESNVAVITVNAPVVVVVTPPPAPVAPVVTPSAPVVTPSAPVVTPSAPVVAPSAPVITPVAPITTPSAPATPSNDSRLVNVSIRTVPGTGADTLIVGFVTSGDNKSILVRGIGPTLGAYTASPTLAAPVLDLYQSHSETPLASNSQWGGTTVLRDTFARVGAFTLDDQSKDAAILATLTPNVYSAQLKGDGHGLAIAEIYDADAGNASTGHIVNLSARTQVGTGDNVLIAGFVIAGNAPKKLLIRAVGPTLGSYGVAGAMEDPKLDVFVAGNPTPILSNDNWNGDAELAAAFAASGAFAFSDASSKDAAMIVTLNPGAYSAKISGVNNTTGVALIEIYELP